MIRGACPLASVKCPPPLPGVLRGGRGYTKSHLKMYVLGVYILGRVGSLLTRASSAVLTSVVALRKGRLRPSNRSAQASLFDNLTHGLGLRNNPRVAGSAITNT